MKIIWIFLLLFTLSAGFDVTVDLLFGMKLRTALRSLLTIFKFMSGTERLILFMLIFFLFIQFFAAFRNQKRKKPKSAKG